MACTETIGEAEIRNAVKILARSERGKAAMRDTLDMLDGGGISLDALGQSALFTLLLAAFGKYPGMARDVMREAIE